MRPVLAILDQTVIGECIVPDPEQLLTNGLIWYSTRRATVGFIVEAGIVVRPVLAILDQTVIRECIVPDSEQLLINGLIWYSTRRATVGLIVEAGIVVDCPPYARQWTYGRSAAQVWQQGVDQGALLYWLPD